MNMDDKDQLDNINKDSNAQNIQNSQQQKSQNDSQQDFQQYLADTEPTDFPSDNPQKSQIEQQSGQNKSNQSSNRQQSNQKIQSHHQEQSSQNKKQEKNDSPSPDIQKQEIEKLPQEPQTAQINVNKSKQILGSEVQNLKLKQYQVQNKQIQSENNQVVELPIFNQTKSQSIKKSQMKQQIQCEQEDHASQQIQSSTIIDPIQQLIKDNPLPFLAVIDKYQIEDTTSEGVPLLCHLSNKFLPLTMIPDQPIKFKTDPDGRSPLHYAVEQDDVQSAYWCLSRGAKNKCDNFGNTPIMDAIRLGHRRCFLLCVHFQHIDEFLPHVCAKYNRLWQLRVLQAAGINIITSKDDHASFPLEVAVQNYSYDCIEYLTRASPAVSLSKLSNLTDSAPIIQLIKSTKLKQSQLYSNWIPMCSIVFWIIFFISSFLLLPYFNTRKQGRIEQLLFIIALYMLMMAISIVKKPKKNKSKDFLTLLKQPMFPPLNDICPSCLDFQNPHQQDHCEICECCVRKFHYHSVVCVNKYNQIVWFIMEFFWLYFMVSLLRQFTAHSMVTQLSLVDDYFLFDFLRALNLEYQNSNYTLIIFFIVTFFACLQQSFYCIQLLGMMLTNRTYQQITKSQKYPHLYYPYKDPVDKKIKNREHRIFYEHKLSGCIIVLKNAAKYFF